jgi:hypothetical protein
MEGFKTLAKGVKCFKEGGSVYKSRHSEKSEQKSDIKQDKAIVKKGVKQHEAALHKGEPKTELKLKQGGRSKKAVGTVKKFKCGGGVFGAKKTKEDIKNMDAAKTCKPKKLAIGGQPGASEAQQKFYNKNKAEATVKEDKALYEAVGSRGDAARKGMSEGRMDPMGTAHKKGGKIKKYAAGGSTSSIDEDVRARAMKWIESGSPENTETAETPVAKKTVKKEVKLYKPDYSNEDLDRMGMNKDLKQPEFDREENSAWMRAYRKNEAKAKQPESDREENSAWMRDYRKNEAKSKAPTKSLRNLKRGGKAKKMNTGGTCS